MQSSALVFFALVGGSLLTALVTSPAASAPSSARRDDTAASGVAPELGSGAVTVAGQPIALLQLRSAVARCRRDAPELAVPTCLRDFIVPLWLLDAEASKRGLAQSERGRSRVRALLYEALGEQLARDLPEPSDELVLAYVEQHHAELFRPHRMRLFRILVNSEHEARALLSQLRADTTPEEFRQLARIRSQDGSSRERGGDLGFVAADGTTDVGSASVGSALYEAARAVADGAFVPRPVKEGERYAVLWRRGSLAAEPDQPSAARALGAMRLREAAVGRALAEIVRGAAPMRHPSLLAKLQRAECRIFER